MADVVGMTILKNFAYRGGFEEYSNTYHLTGAVPADDAAWTALFDALVAAEKPVNHPGVSYLGGYGYNSDDIHAHAVFVHDISAAPIAGTLATAGGAAMPGDAAVWLRWKTSRVNSRGKPIYLRKYFHPAVANSSATPDVILVAQKNALNALGLKLTDGTFLDGRLIRSRTHAEVIVSHAASAFITTRTLKRRGKRPS